MNKLTSLGNIKWSLYWGSLPSMVTALEAQGIKTESAHDSALMGAQK